MTRKSRQQPASGHIILLVDDNPEYLEATRRLLENEGHQVICAMNGAEGLELLRHRHIDLLLLDYYMPGMTGEQVVAELRQFNPYVQVILQTGYATEQPPRELLRRLDIQGYYDKSEGPEKLLLWTDAGLKAAFTIQMLNKSRMGLRYILEVTPDLHKIQPLDDLLQGILLQLAGLVGATNSFLAVLPNAAGGKLSAPQFEGFLAMLDDESELVIRASTGRFRGQRKLSLLLDSDRIDLIGQALQRGEIQIDENLSVVPLRVGDLTLGLIYLDRPVVTEQDRELLHIFANQSAVAIQNMTLYEMATLDPLTGVYSRGFFDKWLQRELRTAFRSSSSVGLLMLDVDNMKMLNDTAGHLTGDRALATLGEILRKATRSNDIVARYGGDEFAIIVSHTPAEAIQHIGNRILDSLRDKYLPGPAGPLPLQVSIGAAFLASHEVVLEIPRPIPQAYFLVAGRTCIQAADEALYSAKRNHGNQMVCSGPVLWPAPGAVDLLLENSID